jgi:hypothetical protein
VHGADIKVVEEATRRQVTVAGQQHGRLRATEPDTENHDNRRRKRYILSILKARLDAKGNFAVDTFSTGKDALRAFASRLSDYYDLVLTDIHICPK